MKDILKSKDSNDSFGFDDEDRFRRLEEFVSYPKNKTGTGLSEYTSAFKVDCIQKLEYDIAAVVISIDSPTFSRTTKNLRVTFQGKLASIGKILD